MKFEKSPAEESEAVKDAKSSLKNVRALEKAGAKVLSDAEMKKNREELMERLHGIEKAAARYFEEYGHADKAVFQALIELGYIDTGLNHEE